MLRRKLITNSYLTEVCQMYIARPNRRSSTVIDSDEASHFKKQSSTWWDKMGPNKPLHAMNQVRIPFIRDGLINSGAIKKDLINTATPLKDLSILDVGCGGGILSEAIARLGANVIGLDGSMEMTKIAKDHAALDKNLRSLQYIEGSVGDHAKSFTEKYDAVVLSEVIEHVSEKEAFLEACTKCLKPGGSIFVTTIGQTTVSWIAAILLAEQILRLIPAGTHHWDKFIQPHQLQRILEDNKCRTHLIHGFYYNFFTNTWHWKSDTSVNYGLHAVKDI